MGMEKLAIVQQEGLRTDLPPFRAGDTVKVMVRVREGWSRMGRPDLAITSKIGQNFCSSSGSPLALLAI